MQIIKIKITDIVTDSEQPRKIFDEEQIQNLASSIKKYGLLQPILVKKIDDKYQIIAGERRYRASVISGISEIDAIIKDDENLSQIALIENIQRENLSVLEEAEAIKKLKDENNYTHEELASILGKSRVYITNKLRILGADEHTKKLLEDNKISEGHAKALLTEKNIKKRRELANKILSDGLSVRVVEKNIKVAKETEKNDDYDDIIELLEDKLGTKISIEGNGTGRIRIDFYSYEQLCDIAKIIMGE